LTDHPAFSGPLCDIFRLALFTVLKKEVEEWKVGGVEGEHADSFMIKIKKVKIVPLKIKNTD
jgi:hypothetical protein